LPAEIKKRAIANLVAVRIPDGKISWLKTTLSRKTEQVRQEIHLALQAQGFSQSNFDQIGL
jgi:hypothetical protein